MPTHPAALRPWGGIKMKERNSKKTIRRVARSVIFFAVAGTLLLYILFEAFLPQATLTYFGFKPYVVVTRSMEPVIRVDDVVIVTGTDIALLEEGDIITFLADINYDGQKNVVTHYIHSLEENSAGEMIIQTRRHFAESADIRPDTWLLREADILGQHAFTIPRIGLAIRYLQSPPGIVALAVNGLVVLAVFSLLHHDKKKDNNAAGGGENGEGKTYIPRESKDENKKES